VTVPLTALSRDSSAQGLVRVAPLHPDARISSPCCGEERAGPRWDAVCPSAPPAVSWMGMFFRGDRPFLVRAHPRLLFSAALHPGDFFCRLGLISP